MPFLSSSDIPSVALESMNQVHFEEIELLNALADTLEEESSSDEAVDAALEALVAHTREHFASEEDKMRRGGFPPYPIHKGEHERQLTVVAKVVEDWRTARDRDALRRFVREELPAWVVHHIQTMDAMTAQFLAGVDPTL